MVLILSVKLVTSIHLSFHIISLFLSPTLKLLRYEVESDENRILMAIAIGRRYMGIECEIKDHDDANEKTELNNLSQNNVSSPKRNQINEKTEGQSLTDSDLVIDILNDELISPVKQKIQCKAKSFN